MLGCCSISCYLKYSCISNCSRRLVLMKYFKISSILAAIALVCALILAAMDMLTSPIVAKNNKETDEVAGPGQAVALHAVD